MPQPRAIARLGTPALTRFDYVAATRRRAPPETMPAFNGVLPYFAVPAKFLRVCWRHNV
jgi:hypothetical protein